MRNDAPERGHRARACSARVARARGRWRQVDAVVRRPRRPAARRRRGVPAVGAPPTMPARGSRSRRTTARAATRCCIAREHWAEALELARRRRRPGAPAAPRRGRGTVRRHRRADRRRHPRTTSPRLEAPMEIADSFRVSTPIDETWKVLLDIERIAPCLPGAQLARDRGRRVPRHREGEGRPDHRAVQGHREARRGRRGEPPHRDRRVGPRHARPGQRQGHDRRHDDRPTATAPTVDCRHRPRRSPARSRSSGGACSPTCRRSCWGSSSRTSSATCSPDPRSTSCAAAAEDAAREPRPRRRRRRPPRRPGGVGEPGRVRTTAIPPLSGPPATNGALKTDAGVTVRTIDAARRSSRSTSFELGGSPVLKRLMPLVGHRAWLLALWRVRRHRRSARLRPTGP